MVLSSPEAFRNALWMILSSFLVFLMQAGFLCVEAGLTRRKNSINVAIKNITDLGISVIIFWAFDYSFMFGSPIDGWPLSTAMFPDVGNMDIEATVFFLFHAMFCSTSVTILSGAVAERMTFRGYLFITGLVSGLLYPVFGRWAWNGLNQDALTGWLGQQGFVDFAGSTVVHSVGGWAALATVLIIGPRLGRFSRKRSLQMITSADAPLALLGAHLRWFGWFGFNGGSPLAFNAEVPSILVNTLFAGAAGLVSPLLWNLSRSKTISKIGAEEFLTLMVRDVSDRKKTEAALQKSELEARNNAKQLRATLEQLKQAQAKLLQSEKMSSLGQIVAGVAHEINNPVGFIHGNLKYSRDYVQCLLQALDHYQDYAKELPSEIQSEIDELDLNFLKQDFPQLLNSMQYGTERIQTIVQSLRNFSRFDEADC